MLTIIESHKSNSTLGLFMCGFVVCRLPALAV